MPWLHTRLALPAAILAVLLMLHIGGDRPFAVEPSAPPGAVRGTDSVLRDRLAGRSFA